MKIVLVASILHPTQSAGIGGMATFNYSLSAGLNNISNQEIVLFASGDSRVNCPLEAITPDAILDKNSAKLTSEQKEKENQAYIKALRKIKAENFDIVHHNHNNAAAIIESVRLGLPTVLTVHVSRDIPFIDDIKKAIKDDFNKIYFVSISLAHRKIHPDLNFFDNVYNGINVDDFRCSAVSQDYIFWMGRIAPYKGLKDAVEISTIVRKELKFAGPINDQKYFNGLSKANYLGILDKNDRQKYLANAKVLLFPIHWEEPFGLVMIEAMACGTPVVAFDRGSVREIIKDGITGFICPPDNIEAMKKAVERIYAMSEKEYRQMRVNCRKHVEENFTVEKMVDGYEKVYQKVIEEWKNKK